MKKTQSNQKMCEFISKLLDMMQKFPSSIFWAQNNDELFFTKLKFIEEEILPYYFRHSNFSSFIRQLNMYGFCKKEKNKDFLKFKHKIFKRGNQHQFHTIKRKSKQKQHHSIQILPQHDYNDQIINMKIQKNSNLQEVQKQLILKMLQQKNKKQNILILVKQNISQLINYVVDQSDLYKQTIQQIKEQFLYKITHSLDQAQRITQFINISVSINDQNSFKITQQDHQYMSLQQECSFEKNVEESQRCELQCKKSSPDRLLQSQLNESVYYLQNDNCNQYWRQN